VHTDLLSRLSGLYALTRDGELGVYDKQGQLQIETELSAAMRDRTVPLLKSYLSNESGEAIRIGLIYPTHEPRPWKTDTLFFEEHIVRQLFPAGDLHSPLTGFQKRNQENSFYRGMELLIASRITQTNTQTWCPVLFNCDGTLDAYVHVLQRAGKPEDAQIPVIEVLNLYALLNNVQRDTPELHAIQEKARETLIRKDARREKQYTLIDDIELRSSKGGGYDENERASREVTLTAEDLARLHESQRHERVERWLEVPHRTIIPGDLRRFVQFSELNDAALNVLAERSLVYTAPAQTVLLDSGMTDKWNMYLLEGTLLLETKDGQSLTIEGGSQAATAAIAFLKPRKYRVSTLSRVSFLWINDALLRALNEVRRDKPPATLKAKLLDLFGSRPPTQRR
jgi:hypothetical protein